MPTVCTAMRRGQALRSALVVVFFYGEVISLIFGTSYMIAVAPCTAVADVDTLFVLPNSLSLARKYSST